MKEKWKNILGYEQIYEISNLSRVRRIKGGPGAKIDRILSQFFRGRGKHKYLCVTLSGGNTKSCKRPIHRLMLEAFVGLCPLGMECRHLDGNAHNNRLNNIQWGTSQENTNDITGHGTKACGEKLPQSKLNDSKVRKIRQLYGTGGWTHRKLAEIFNVSHYAIWRVVTRRTWEHVE